MKEKILKILNNLIHNRVIMCTIILILFLLFMIFLSDYDLVSRFKNRHKIKELENEIERYDELIKQDQQRIEELQGDDETLEKFACEQYYMKKDNEDIFIIEEN